EPLLAELDGLGRAHVERIDGWQTRIIRFEAGWDAYWQQRSSQLRRTIERKEKRLACTPHRLYAADPSAFPALMAEVFERHAARWIPTAQRNWESYYGMYRAIVEQALAREAVHVHVLEIEGQIAACELSIQHGDWCYAIFKTYDSAFSAYSPGSVLTKWALQRLFEHGVRQVDPGGGNDTWKEDFKTDSLRTIQPLIASPLSLTGNAVVAWKAQIRPLLHDHRWLVSAIKALREARRQPLFTASVAQQLQ
ncbi:MAG TPA: GNAT family N-acetyltransferase, partial [Stenomitos sp.]